MKGLNRFSVVAAAMLVPALVLAAPDLGSSVYELNREIAKLLRPYQTETTRARIVFNRIISSAQHALALDVVGFYMKKGTQNALAVKVTDLNYDYGNGKHPTTRVRGGVELDLVKLLGQEGVNRFGNSADQLVEDWIKDYAKEYGDAATVQARVSDKKTDSQGNLESLKMELLLKVRLDQLPPTTPRNSVIFLEVKLDIGASRQGIALAATLVSNPEYKGFEKDRQGLKDYLEKLLSRDEKTLQELVSLIQGIDSIAQQIVEYKAP